MLFDAIRNWLISLGNNDNHYIRVLQPIGPMPGLLTKCGFVPTKNIRNQQGMNWLFNNGSLGDVSMVRMLIFREYDYIAPLNNSLKCNIPIYSYKELI